MGDEWGGNWEWWTKQPRVISIYCWEGGKSGVFRIVRDQTKMEKTWAKISARMAKTKKGEISKIERFRWSIYAWEVARNRLKPWPLGQRPDVSVTQFEIWSLIPKYFFWKRWWFSRSVPRSNASQKRVGITQHLQRTNSNFGWILESYTSRRQPRPSHHFLRQRLIFEEVPTLLFSLKMIRTNFLRPKGLNSDHSVTYFAREFLSSFATRATRKTIQEIFFPLIEGIDSRNRPIFDLRVVRENNFAFSQLLSDPNKSHTFTVSLTGIFRF